jgi:hypothetical protein
MTTKPVDPTIEYILLGSNGATAVVDGDVELPLNLPRRSSNSRSSTSRG